METCIHGWKNSRFAVWRKTMGLFSKLFDPNAGEIKRLQKIVDKIDSFEAAHKKLSDSELRAKTEEFKNWSTLQGDGRQKTHGQF